MPSHSQRKRPRIDQDNSTSSLLLPSSIAGRISGIVLQNFMCHENLRLNLDLSTNNCFYIGGPNGSGKSALFAAINIGLGGRGNLNERGNSVKNYVKDGQSKAFIRVELTNRGPDAVNSDIYGDLIVVERTIRIGQNRQCCSTYELKGCFPREQNAKLREVTVSSKKADLDFILERMNIQLNNPIFWMSQDRSRQFLQEMQPKKLYQMFMHGTELETMISGYNKVNENMANFEIQLEGVKKLFAKKQEELHNLRKKLNQHRNLNKERDGLNQLGWLKLWVVVRDIRMEIRKKEITIEKAIKYLNDNQMGEMQKEREKLIETSNGIDREIAELTREATNGSEELKERRSEVETTMNEVRKCREEARNNTRDLHCCQEEFNVLKRQLNSMCSKFSTDKDGQTRVKLTEKKLEFRDRRNDVQNRINLVEDQLPNLDKSCTELEQNTSQLQFEIGNQTREIDRKKRNVEQLGASLGNEVARFDTKMPALLQLIGNESGFRRKPIGPLGQYVQVRDSRWCLAAELAIGAGLLCAFVCDCFSDSRLLLKLMKQCSFSHTPPIIVSKFVHLRHDTRRFSPPFEFDTVLKMVEISDVQAYNTLVDQAQIETIILIKNEDQLREIMQFRPPANTPKGFSISGAQAFSARNQYRFYANTRARQSKYLNRDVNSGDVDRLMAEIRRMEQDLTAKRTEYKESCSKYQLLKGLRDAEKSRLFVAQNELLEITNELRKIDRQLREEELEPGSNQEILTNQVEETGERVESWKRKVADSKRKLDEVELHGGRAQKEEEESSVHCVQLRSRAQTLRIRIQSSDDIQIEANKLDLDTKLQKCDLQLDLEVEIRRKAERIRARIESETVELRSKLTTAESNLSPSNCRLPVALGYQNPPDLDTLPDTEKTNNEYSMLEQKLLSTQQVLGQPEQDRRLYDECRLQYRKLRDTIGQLEMLLETFRRSMAVRKTRIRLIKRYMSLRLKLAFQRLMNMRQFGGKVIVNHAEKTIEIIVETHRIAGDREGAADLDVPVARDRSRAKQKRRDLRGLSGGERSYTTACFVMSLWEMVEAPFRMMDEFDVFMDVVNRHIIMDLLIDMATNDYPDFQFIFFTPQGLRQLGDRNGVQVFEMPRVRDSSR